MKYNIKKENQILGQIQFHEQLDQAARGDQQQIDKKQKKVLILHTGGTIGMFRDSEGKFRPEKDRFKHFLSNYPYFCDEDETYFNSTDGFAITPQSVYHRKIWYRFKEFQTLIDSTNSNIKKINEILFQLEKEYDNYDAFVVLHGTDTMAYTSSALSFMIENLKKTIVVTGAQVPMGEVRNDSINNLLCALTIAGHFVIPQVLLVFDNKILRGNRATKTSASLFNSFKSPNSFPLGYLNLKIQIYWEMIRHCKKDEDTKFVPLKYEVETMKITPFSTPTIPKSKYIVLESLGTGNVPTEGPYSQWLKQNAKLDESKRKVIVNISQVYQSVILNLYATGNQAMKLGLIPGSDMTCQAAMAKLSYLASKGYTQGEKLKQLMMTNLREQLTQTKDRLVTTKTNYILRCMAILQKNFSKQSTHYQTMLRQIVYPLLLGQRVSKSGVDRLRHYEFDVNYVYADGSNVLHYYSKMKALQDHQELFLRFLLDKKVNINLVDHEGNSPLFYALLTGKYHEAEILRQYGAKLHTNSRRIFQAVRNQQVSLLHALVKYGDKFQYKDQEERNLAMYSIITGKKDVANFLNDFTDMFEEEGIEIKDIYGNTLKFYMEAFKFSFE